MHLQSLIARANDIQEAPSNVTPIASTDLQKKYPEEQQFSNKSFPSTGINPSKLYTGRNSNVPMTSAIQLNRFVKKQRIPIKVIENSALSFDTEKKETSTKYSNEVNYVAPIEVVNNPIEISDEVSDVAPIEVDNAPIEFLDEVSDAATIEVDNTPFEFLNEVSDVATIEVDNAPFEFSDEVSDVATIEVDNAPFEIPNDMKRQQHKNKKKSWLFNFFRKIN